MLVAFLVSLTYVSSEAIIQQKTHNGLDPGRIIWAQDSWYSSALYPDSNHDNNSPFSLTFHIRPEHDASFIQLICPIEVTCNTLEVNQDLTAGTDTTVTFEDVSMADGSYGPFGLITRKSQDGQIIDANFVFGSVTILDNVSIGSMVVEQANDESDNKIGTSVDLLFSFSLSVDIWKYDVIVLEIDQEYTASSNSECMVSQVQGQENQMQGVDQSLNLGCIKNSEGNIEIYGLTTDVWSDGGYLVEIQVTGFTLPSAVISSYGWGATVYRFGTKTIVAQYSSTSNPVDIEAGSISVNSITNYLDTCSDFFFSGISSFFRTSFTTQHSIPASGSIQVTFQGGDPTAEFYQGGGNDDCLVQDYDSDEVSCSSSGNEVTIQILNTEITAGTFVLITRNAVSDSQISISSVVSKNQNSNIIDSMSSSDSSFEMSRENIQILDEFQVQVNQGTYRSNTGIGGEESNSVMFFLDHSDDSKTNLQDQSEVVFYVPFLTQTSQENKQLLVPTTAVFELNIALNPLSGDGNAITPIPTYSGGDRTIEITTTSEVVLQSSDHTPLLLQAYDGVKAPYIQSNLATFYQVCVVQANKGNDDEVDLYTVAIALLDIEASYMELAWASLVCVGTGMAHPFVLVFQESQNPPELKSANFQVTITADSLGLGIETDIPHYFEQGDLNVETSDSNTFVLSDWPEDMTSTQTLVVWLPTGNSSPSDYTTSVNFEYPDSDFPNVFNRLYTGSSTNVNVDQNPNQSTVSFVNPQDEIEPSIDQNFQFNYFSGESGSEQKDGIHINIPHEVEFTNIQLSGSFQSVYLLVSDDSNFNGNMIIATQSSTEIIKSLQETQITLEGVVSGQHQGEDSTWQFADYEQDSEGIPKIAQQCYSQGQVVIDVVASEMNAPTLLQSSCNIRGANNYDSTLVIQVSVQNKIPIGGKIVIEILEFEASELSSCEAEDHECSISDQIATVTATTAIEQQEVTVYLNGLYAPQIGEGNQVFLINSVHSEIEGEYIESPYDQKTGSCTISAAGSTGSIQVNSILAYPNAAGLITDFYLEVKVEKILPAGSTLVIATETNLGILYSGENENKQDECWVSIEYDSCMVSSGELTITISEDHDSGKVIEIYLDDAIQLSASAGIIQESIHIEAMWSSILIAQTDQDFIINSAPIGELTQESGSAITVDVTSAGEYSDYHFAFSVDQRLTSTNEIWIEFPNEYDPYIGYVVQTNQDCWENYYRIGCESEALGTDINCYADHWNVVISNITTVQINESILITIEKVKNPSEQTTSQFEIIVISNIDQTVLAANQQFGTVSITDVPENLVLQRVQATNHLLGQISNFVFSFYTETDLTQDLTITVEFPKQFQIQITEGDQVSVGCQLVYYDQSSSSNDPSQAIEIGNSISCLVQDQLFMYEISSSSSYLQGRMTNRIQVSFEGVQNPDWGYKRQQDDDDLLWDNHDHTSQQTFQEFQYWTNRFSLYLLDHANNQVNFRSTDYLNSAYLGLNWPNKNSLTVNDFDPATIENSIDIYAGTQSHDIPITINNNFPLTSIDLYVEPELNKFTTSSGISFSSWAHNYTFHHWTQTIYFRVAASREVSDGVYYLEWSVTENREQVYNEDQYNRPARSIIQVCHTSSQDQVQVQVSGFPEVFYKDQTSNPIKVSLQNAPASNYILTLQSSHQDIEIKPDTLEFKPDISTLYFEIEIDEDFDADQETQDILISFVESGEDAEVFIAPSTIMIEVNDIQEDEQLQNPLFTELMVRMVDLNEGSVIFQGDSNGIVYWYFGCQGTYYDFDDLLQEIDDQYGDLTEWKGHSPYQIQLKEAYQDMFLPDEDEDIIEYFWNRVREDCTSHFIGATMSEQDVSQTIHFQNLHDSSIYDFGAYIVRNSQDQVNPKLEQTSFTTSSKPRLYWLTLTIQKEIDQEKDDAFTDIVAVTLGVNPLWLYNLEISKNSDQTSYSWIVLYSDTLSVWSSENLIDISELENQASELIIEQIGDEDFTQTSGVSWNAGIVPNTIVIPDWIKEPEKVDADGESIIFVATLDDDGQVFATCHEGDNENEVLSEFQVFFGLDLEGEKAGWGWTKAVSDLEFKLVVEGLDDGDDYFCQFLICNDSPLYPNCQDYEMDRPLILEESSDFALNLGVGVVLILSLIFN